MPFVPEHTPLEVLLYVDEHPGFVYEMQQFLYQTNAPVADALNSFFRETDDPDSYWEAALIVYDCLERHGVIPEVTPHVKSRVAERFIIGQAGYLDTIIRIMQRENHFLARFVHNSLPATVVFSDPEALFTSIQLMYALIRNQEIENRKADRTSKPIYPT